MWSGARVGRSWPLNGAFVGFMGGSALLAVLVPRLGRGAWSRAERAGALTQSGLLEDPTRSTGLGGAERFDVVALGDDRESAVGVVERVHEALLLRQDGALGDALGAVVGHQRQES